MSLKLILYSAITIFFNGAVLRRYLKDELLLTGPYTLLVLLPTITQPICQLVFGGFCGITLFAIASYQIYKRLPQQFLEEEGKYVFISGCDSGIGYATAKALDAKGSKHHCWMLVQREVQGCDSGIGYATAKALDAKGINVIAGCLFKGKDGEQNLVQECSDRLVTVQLDVTSEESVKSTVKVVKEKLKGKDFWGLINNAGIMYVYELEAMPLQFYQKMMDVNFYGAIRLTQAFLPLLRSSKGRIVSVASIASDMCFPNGSGYNATKAALKMAMDSLRLELMKWGVQVATVHPTAYATGILNQENLKRNFFEVSDATDPALADHYGPRYVEALQKSWESFGAPSEDFSPVVNCIEHALFAKRPLTHYIDTVASEIVIWLTTILPVGLSKFIYSGLAIPASAFGTEERTDQTDGRNSTGAVVNGSEAAEASTE